MLEAALFHDLEEALTYLPILRYYSHIYHKNSMSAMYGTNQGSTNLPVPRILFENSIEVKAISK
jgi:hypothetical protein